MASERVHDALDALDLIESRLQGVSAERLAADSVLLDACCYRIVIVGEAIDYAKTHRPDVFAGTVVGGTTWDSLVQIRNHFVHSYAKVTAQIVLMYLKGAPAVRLALGNVTGKL